MKSFRAALSLAMAAGLPAAILPPAYGSGMFFLHKSSTKNSPISIPFRDVDHEIVVTLSLNGHKGLNFLIDTGLGGTILDASAAAAAQVKTVPIKFSLASQAGTFPVTQAARSVRIDGYGLELCNNMLVGDLSLVGQRLGIPVAGTLGFDFLAQFPFLLDYSAKTMTIFSPQDSNVPLQKGTQLPLEAPVAGEVNGPVVSLDVELPNGRQVTAKLIVDTGSTTGVTLHAPFVEKYGLRPDNNTRIPGQISYGGSSYLVHGQLNALMLGDMRVADFPALYAEQPAGMAANKLIDGEIGYKILSRFRIYMDAPHHRIVFEPVAQK